MEGNLQDLNPIILPDAVGWLPLAPGWIVLGVLLGAGLVTLAWRRWLRWRDQRYRREALRELAAMEDLTALPNLLKRAALSAWPRERVASLTGTAWHRFLDESAGHNHDAQVAFAGVLGPQLDALTYGGSGLGPDEEARLRAAARDWLRNHRVET